MLAGEEVGFEREWEDVFVLSKMGRIGKLPANFLFFAKSGMACLARLAQGAPKPALDLAYSPSKECRALVFAVESRLAPCDMPVLCAKLDIEPKVWTEDDGCQDAPAGRLFVNYFDKTLGEVPQDVLPALREAMARTRRGPSRAQGGHGEDAEPRGRLHRQEGRQKPRRLPRPAVAL